MTTCASPAIDESGGSGDAPVARDDEVGLFGEHGLARRRGLEPDVDAEARRAPARGRRRSRAAPRGSGRPRRLRSWPPATSACSKRTTSCPASAATRAASRPAGPPPATTTRFGSRPRSRLAPLRLASGARVDGARHEPVRGAAVLHDADARPDLRGRPVARLRDPLRSRRSRRGRSRRSRPAPTRALARRASGSGSAPRRSRARRRPASPPRRGRA